SNAPVGNYVAKERWREAIVMDLGRGNLLFPQIWGDIFLLNEDDVAFVARLQKFAGENAAIFLKRKKILGDPWNNEPYGYAYFQGGRGFLFMNNLHFDARLVRLQLDETIGLRAPAGARLRLSARFPEEATLLKGHQAVFAAAEKVEAWLRPFEVAMWEILPENAGEAAGLAERDIGMKLEGHRLALQAETAGPEAEIVFGEPRWEVRSTFRRPSLDELRGAGYQRRVIVRRAKLPALDDI